MEIASSYKGPTVYATNKVSDTLVCVVKKGLEVYDGVHVSFDVTGRTCHSILANQLANRLGDNYIVEVGYNYTCFVKHARKEV